MVTTREYAESIGLEYAETGGGCTAFTYCKTGETWDHEILVTSTVDAWIPESLDEQTVAGYYDEGAHQLDIAEGPFLEVMAKVCEFIAIHPEWFK